MGTFDYPFSKTGKKTEEEADAVRICYNFPAQRHLSPDELAECMPVRFTSLGELVDVSQELLHQVQHDHSDHWDAFTLPTPIGGRYWIFLNDHKPLTRIRITRMEELLHIHYGHQPTRLSVSSNIVDGLRMRTYNRAEERQAYAVGAALLVPWREFCFDINRGASARELALRFEVSEDLMNFRIDTTGLRTLYKSRNKKRA